VNGTSQPLPTREEIAEREIGHTDISRGTARLLIVAFVLMLATPPIAQLAYELCLEPQAAADRMPPSSLQFFARLPIVANAYGAANGGSIRKLLVANSQLLRNIDEYEHQLEERSLLTRLFLGPTREVLAKYGGAGSDQAEIGRDGWLFFRPDIEYVTGPGFLEPHVLSHRASSGSQQAAPLQPDPRLAIIQFHQQLAARGIRLIILPTPGKPSIYPEQLSRRADGNSVPLQNRSFERFKQEMLEAGVLVFDAATVLAEAKRDSANPPLFLRTDTHWTPAGVQIVAKRLREFIDRESPLPKKEPVDYHPRPVDVTSLGDIAVMLRLPSNQSLFPRETATIRQIELPDQQMWQPDASGDVLLLGDSFTNIYSLADLNWGSAAGLAEQLSFQLQRPVDRLAQNDGGAYAVRQSLIQELARGHDRLAGKQIVIWQFAARELASGDWKLLTMPAASTDASPSTDVPATAGDLVVQGIVRAAAGAPRPGTVPYREAVTGIHLVDVKAIQGSIAEREVIVYCWGLKQNQTTNAARLTSGQNVTLRLIPWERVKNRFERFNRIELDDPDFHLVQLPVYWGEEISSVP